jgi:hypothetical protein
MDTREPGLLFLEDFSKGLRTGDEAPAWRLRPVDALPGGDGSVRTDPDGLVVVPTAVHPVTGEPAFAAPETGPGGVPLHMRWAAFTTHATPGGGPGFDASASGPLTVSAELAVCAFGLGEHSYDDVTDADTDPRLGAGGLISADRETGIIFDFFVTHRRVYAVYERLAMRPDADFAAFSYAVPVADREPAQFHRLEVTYDAKVGAAYWAVDGTGVLSVDRIGFRCLDAKYLRQDNGGREEPVLPQRFSYGLGLFTDRHFGQGIQLSVRQLSVLTSPTAG